MKKNLFCLFLTLLMAVCLMSSAFAANDDAADAAQTLYELGLFRGTGTNADGTPIFALEQTPTRNQAVIMLVTHSYESRDGSTGGFFSDNVQAGQQVWHPVNLLLRLNRDWKV